MVKKSGGSLVFWVLLSLYFGVFRFFLRLRRLRVLGTVIMDKQMSLDLLSDLPLGIIHDILSFVLIREAIGTSLLSRQWRYIWTSLPHLVYDCERVNPLMKNESDINRLIPFISQVLLLHEGPIHKFEVRLSHIAVSTAQFQCINQWLLLLSANDIRILVLDFIYMDLSVEVHTSLYSCQNLTHLELHGYEIPTPPPSFKGFLFLRSLFIRTPNVDSSTIESIVAHSPLLEELTLAGKQYSQITIRAPNLKFFRFGYGSTHLSLCTPLLQELIVYSAYVEQFSFEETSVFHHLRIIKLSDVRFNITEAAMAVDCLIRRSPNLQKLEISTLPARKDDAPELACASLWNSGSAPNITYDSLKVIKMKNSGCGTNEIKLIKFLLARSPVLERMICKPCWSLSDQELLNLEGELLSCRRASANAEIVIEKIHSDLLPWLHNFVTAVV